MMTDSTKIILKTPADTEAAAANLAATLSSPAVIYLEGPLGAGKTTFVKGLLRGLGYEGLVKSPTYTLIETYQVNDLTIMHADLYRIKSTDELDAMGFRDYFNPQTIVIVEWASYGRAVLPQPSLLCTLSVLPEGEGRLLEWSVLR